jgi:2',3'-cyclic-nucleotide 3'-phosphodiesterase
VLCSASVYVRLVGFHMPYATNIRRGRNGWGVAPHCGAPNQSLRTSILQPPPHISRINSPTKRMPGSSLWLLPPSDHPLNKLLTTLIHQTSQHFNSTHLFLPHITLTSEISPSKYGIEPQAWLNSLSLPAAKDVRVDFEKLASEDVFFRKLYIKCEKSGLVDLGMVCRREVNDDAEARKWAEESYTPHCSLL